MTAVSFFSPSTPRVVRRLRMTVVTPRVVRRLRMTDGKVFRIIEGVPDGSAIPTRGFTRHGRGASSVWVRMRTFVISTMALGGSARALANLANHFAARGDAIEILTLHGGGDAYALHPAIRRRDLGFRGRPPRPSAESLSFVVANSARFPRAVQLAADAETIAVLRDL